MPNSILKDFNLSRNGTSQAQRLLPALAIDYAQVDERLIEDLLRFAQQLGSEYIYYSKENQAQGDWSGFLGRNPNLMAQLVKYLEQPESFQQDSDELDWLSRPHIVLFLVFLQLLKDFPRQSINQFTQRHLDHYFRDILQFEKKAAQPDQVHILVELAKNYQGDRLPLPFEAQFDGGKDSQGNALIYIPEESLMINRAQVAEIRTVFVNRSVRELVNFDPALELVEMLQLVIGEDVSGNLTPGGDLPPITFLGGPIPGNDPMEIAILNFLKDDLFEFLRFGEGNAQNNPVQGLKMSFADFRKLMRLKQQRDYDLNEWQQINTMLREPTSPPFSNPRDFVANFQAVTGANPINPAVFTSLQNVNDVYELLEELDAVWDAPADDLFAQNKKQDLITFIQEEFYSNAGDELENAQTFREMIAIRMLIIDDWREILELIEANTQVTGLSLDFETPDFDALLQQAYGFGNPTTFFNLAHSSIDTIDQYYETFITIEKYFALTAEEVLAVLEVTTGTRTSDRPLLSREELNAILEKSHHNKKHVKRRQQLNQVRTIVSFIAMIRVALGDPEPGDPLPLSTSLNNLYDAIENLDDSEVPEPIRNEIEQKLFLSLPDFRFVMRVRQDEETPAPGNDGAPPWKWDRVYRLLEKAERTKRGDFPSTKPEVVSLEGVHMAEDATLITTGGKDEDYLRWRTFGNEEMPFARLGLVVASPLLLLEGGRRTITLDIYLASNGLTQDVKTALPTALTPEDGSGAVPAFSVDISGEKDWMPLEEITFSFPTNADGGAGSEDVIRLVAVLALDADPVLALPSDHPDSVITNPAIRLILNDPAQYVLFSQLNIEKIDLSVRVEALLPSHLRNDKALLKPGEPFEPFGIIPKPRSRFYFTHPEIARNKLNSLTLNLSWMGVPNFASLYLNYPTVGGDRKVESNFLATLRMSDKGIRDRASKSVQFFGTLPTDNYTLDLEDATNYEALTNPIITDDLLGSDRFFMLELGALDFGHDEFPRVAAEKANQLAIDIANEAQGAVSAYQVNPPYTPQIETFSISYEASISDIGTENIDGGAQSLHLHPFGYKKLKEGGDAFLAQYVDEGELYIGIKDFHPPGDLSLLFQVAEGSADPDLVPPQLIWSYLNGDNWRSAEVLTNDTGNLLNSGIIRLRIGEDANDQHLLLPSSLYWLRAAVRSNSFGLCDIVGVHTQAVRAILMSEGVATDHFEQPLPPESISKLVKRQPEIKALYQPYSSFGGRPMEPDTNLNVRISERLRHKNRAITPWDYERLVLEHYPQVHRVKCLPDGWPEAENPGRVEIIVVPDIRGVRPFDPFEPKLPINILQEIQSFLQARAPAPAQIVVRNPEYLQLLIRMNVKLYTEFEADAQFYKNELQESLLQLLAPWAYDKGADLVIGGKIYASLIINFVEQQTYIDYIQDFKLLYEIEPGELRPASDTQIQEGLEIPRPDAIWVSAREHLLSTETNVANQGVGYMRVEIDLIVGTIS